jgi:putative tricarboxylic transport membrane protein
VIILSVVGTYAINNSITNVYWMLGFGIFGYILKMYGYQVGPVILGIILGPLMEDNYRRAMLDVHNKLFGFFWEFLRNPLSLVLTLFIVVMIMGQTGAYYRVKHAISKIKR